MSARQRIPLTGRCNITGGGDTGRSYGSNPNTKSGRSDADSSNRRAELNDPATVLRPFSAEGNVRDVHKTRPPILNKSRFPTVPPPDPTLGVPYRGRGRHSKPLFPDGWVEKNLAASYFETVDQASAVFDVERKTLICRDFVERNQQHLWKYNLDYLNKTPRTVADGILDSGAGFVKLMSCLNEKERKLRLSNSDRIKSSLKDDHLNSLGLVKSDIFLQSFETPREVKIQQRLDCLFQHKK